MCKGMRLPIELGPEDRQEPEKSPRSERKPQGVAPIRCTHEMAPAGSSQKHRCIFT